MSEEVTNTITQLKGLLNKYPDKTLEILQYVFGKDTILKIINKPTYEDLQQENKQLKEDKFKLQARADRYKWKLDLCEEVIEEVREFTGSEEMYNCSFEEETNKLLQILDKVKGNK